MKYESKEICDICKNDVECAPYVCNNCGVTICSTDCMKSESINMNEIQFTCPKCKAKILRF